MGVHLNFALSTCSALRAQTVTGWPDLLELGVVVKLVAGLSHALANDWFEAASRGDPDAVPELFTVERTLGAMIADIVVLCC